MNIIVLIIMIDHWPISRNPVDKYRQMDSFFIWCLYADVDRMSSGWKLFFFSFQPMCSWEYNRLKYDISSTFTDILIIKYYIVGDCMHV